MSTQRYISTSFWTDKWVRSLDPSERYLYLYLLTNPQTNIAGIYDITIDRIAFDTGYDERTLWPMLDRFAQAGKAHMIDEEWIVIPTWPSHQRWDQRSKIRAGIEKILRALPKHVLERAHEVGYDFPIPIDTLRYPIDTLSIPYPYDTNYSDTDTDTDRDTDTPKRKADTTHKPTGKPINTTTYNTLVTDYGQKTVDDYMDRIANWEQAKHGGKAKYKDYAAACRDWLRRDKVPLRPKETKPKIDARTLSNVRYQ